MSRFAGLNSKLPDKAVPAPAAEPQASFRAKAREGKKAVTGYFSGELSRELRTLAVAEGKTVQALLGEAVDLLMRDRGKHPFAER